jgi:hypothetical protein
MKNEFTQQYQHTWRIFEGIVEDFDSDSWIHTGCGMTTPARIAFHLLQGVRYYIEDSSALTFVSGKSFEGDWKTAKEEELPSQNDILTCLNELRVKTEKWLSEMDYAAENRSFDWAGQTKVGVVIFLLRHNLYHIGELSALLNESKHGTAEDNWIKAFG